LIFATCIDGSRAVATVSPDPCPTLDNSSHFQRIKDQDGHGLCWAFAAASLLEEQRCLDEPRTCGYEPATLSVLDVSRARWSVNASGQFGGGWVEPALTRALSEGVCLDFDAPFIEGSKFGCRVIKAFGGGDQACLVSKLVEIFDRWKVKTAKIEKPACDVPDNEELRAVYRDLLPDLREILPRQAGLGVDLFKSLTTAKDSTAFLEQVLLTPACKTSRLRFARPGRKLSARSFATRGKTTAESIAELVKVLSTGHSAGLSFCLGGPVWAYFKACPTDEEELRNAPGHAIVIDGMRFNEAKKSCEMHVRNSWGDSSAFNGWYDLEQAAPSFKHFDYLEETR
jgi:hypothetical protein